MSCRLDRHHRGLAPLTASTTGACGTRAQGRKTQGHRTRGPRGQGISLFLETNGYRKRQGDKWLQKASGRQMVTESVWAHAKDRVLALLDFPAAGIHKKSETPEDRQAKKHVMRSRGLFPLLLDRRLCSVCWAESSSTQSSLHEWAPELLSRKGLSLAPCVFFCRVSGKERAATTKQHKDTRAREGSVSFAFGD